MMGARAAGAGATAAAAARRRRKAQEAADGGGDAQSVSVDDEEDDELSDDCVHRLARKMPPWLFLPLLAFVAVLLLLAIMLPVYFSFVKTNSAQNEAVVYPETFDDESIKEQELYIVELDLTDINPDSRVAEFLFDLVLGGELEHETESGVLDLNGNTLAIKLGHQSLSFESGDSVSDQQVQMILEDISPLYNYPFDTYRLNMTIYCSEVNDTDTSNIQSSRLPTGVILFEGEQGWLTSATMSPLYYTNGSLSYGTVVVIDMKRADSVKFFSLFIVLLMWAISLGMFCIAINYVLSKSLEIFYDVPALAIGLLFALPFVRDVQPDIPTLGISVDVMGFFFNMLLIAVSSIVVMGALSSRHHRAQKKLAEERDARELRAMARQMEEGRGRDGSQQPLLADNQKQEDARSWPAVQPPAETIAAVRPPSGGNYRANQVVPEPLPLSDPAPPAQALQEPEPTHAPPAQEQSEPAPVQEESVAPEAAPAALDVAGEGAAAALIPTLEGLQERGDAPEQ